MKKTLILSITLLASFAGVRGMGPAAVNISETAGEQLMQAYQIVSATTPGILSNLTVLQYIQQNSNQYPAVIQMYQDHGTTLETVINQLETQLNQTNNNTQNQNNQE